MFLFQLYNLKRKRYIYTGLKTIVCDGEYKIKSSRSLAYMGFWNSEGIIYVRNLY
jgi:hypothetical protein